MKKIHALVTGLLLLSTSSVFAAKDEPKYETNYSIEKSDQVEHLKITQKSADDLPTHNA